MSVILCLDPGVAHTGIAISYEGILSQPLATIFERDIDTLVGKITPFIVRLNPDVIVVGQPPHGPLRQHDQALSEKIMKIFSGDILLFDEEISSKEARSIMRANKKNISSQKTDEHQTAAAVILRTFLEEHQELS